MSDNFPKAGWRPLSEGDLTQSIVDELSKEIPNLTVVKNWVGSLFSQQTGLQIDQHNSSTNTIFARWLGYQQANSALSLQIRKYPRLQHVFFDTYSTKVNSLSQRHCYICHPTRPYSVMPIRITPRSRQNIARLDRNAFHRAIAHWASTREPGIDLSQRFCLAFTFVLDESGVDKDLDNMIKILQDAIARAFSFNDRHVHHLDLLKLIMPVAEEYVYVRMMNSQINEHRDVLAPIENHVFATGPALKLDDFLIEP